MRNALGLLGRCCNSASSRGQAVVRWQLATDPLSQGFCDANHRLNLEPQRSAAIWLAAHVFPPDRRRAKNLVALACYCRLLYLAARPVQSSGSPFKVKRLQFPRLLTSKFER